MICPECGSYQPERAKYCGICGSALSQEGLMESFLGDKTEHDIVLPRRRSIAFYLLLVVIVAASLAALAGGGYLVYLLAWGGGGERQGQTEVLDNTLDYSDQDLGFSISYPKNWTLANEVLENDELTSLTIALTSRKSISLRAFQLDPLVSIGGIESIEEFLEKDAQKRMRALGGNPEDAVSTPTGGKPAAGSGYGTGPGGTTGTEDRASGEETGGYGFFTSSKVSGFPAFYTEFDANLMGEETRYLLFYIVAGDYLFLFQGQAPYGEYKAIRPQFFSITGSFKWETGEGGAQETPL